MSFTRQLLREFRPLFRMLEEPISRSNSQSYLGSNYPLTRSFPFDAFNIDRPTIDVAEEGDKFILEAELPGVKKENIEVRIGDAGRSVTVEGNFTTRRQQPEHVDAPKIIGSEEATPDQAQNQISTERTFNGNSSFRRTVWLPRPVDSNNVIANLDHGILTVTINKAEDKGSVVVPIQ